MTTSKKGSKQPTRVKALDKCLSYNEKVRKMVLEVLREETGRELASSANSKGSEFDWKQHNIDFREDYSATALKELIGYCAEYYGLKTLDEIRERRQQHKETRSKRIAKKNETPDDELDLTGDSNLDDDLSSELEDDFDEIPK
jgi:hypothetical protein